jgi:hypothetical protein
MISYFRKDEATVPERKKNPASFTESKRKELAMDISIEQVEKLKERADITYEEAREALEKAGGDLLEAIILLEREGKTARNTGFYSTNGALPVGEGEMPRQEGSASGNFGTGAGDACAGGGSGSPPGSDGGGSGGFAGGNGAENGSGNCGGGNGSYNQGGQYGQGAGAGNAGNNSANFSDLLNRFWSFAVRVFHKGMCNFFEVYTNGKILVNVPVLFLALALIFVLPATLILLLVGLFCGCRYRFAGPDLGREDINRAMNSAADTAENMKQTARDSGKKDDNNQKS